MATPRSRFIHSSSLRGVQRGRDGLSGLQRVLDPLRLRLVVELQRHGSITSAANACGIGQPTASAHLRTIEMAAGIKLYERTPRGTRLTDAGELLARQAALVMADLDDLERGLGELAGGRSGTLRVAVCESYGVRPLPEVLAAFAGERPRADVRVRVATSAEVLREVQRGDAELGVAGESPGMRGVVAEPLLREELVGIAASGSAVPARIDGTELARLTLLLPSVGSSSRALLEQRLERLRCRPARTIELEAPEAIKRAVTAGLGVAFLPSGAVVGELTRGELREFRLDGPPLERDVDLVRSADRRPSVLGLAFERAIRAAARQTPAVGRPCSVAGS